MDMQKKESTSYRLKKNYNLLKAKFHPYGLLKNRYYLTIAIKHHKRNIKQNKPCAICENLFDFRV
jgi:hypothetical protein